MCLLFVVLGWFGMICLACPYPDSCSIGVFVPPRLSKENKEEWLCESQKLWVFPQLGAQQGVDGIVKDLPLNPLGRSVKPMLGTSCCKGHGKEAWVCSFLQLGGLEP